MKMFLLNTIYLLSMISSAWAQETTSTGGGNEPEFLPKSQVLQFEPMKLERGGSGGISQTEAQKREARLKELNLSHVNQNDFSYVAKLVNLVNKVKSYDFHCAEEAKLKSPLSYDIFDFYKITQNIARKKFEADLSGMGGVGPLRDCDCDADEKYLACLKSSFQPENHDFWKLTKEDQLRAYKILNVETSKKLDKIEHELEYIQSFLPGCYK